MGTFIIAISGISGSGKSMLAKAILNNFSEQNCLIIAEDNYYKDLSHIPTREERLKTNFDTPEAIDHNLLISHLRSLKNADNSIDMPQYDFNTCTRKPSVKIESKKLIIVEGLFILSNENLCGLFDIKIYVDCHSTIAFSRRIKRDLSDRSLSVNYTVNQYPLTIHQGESRVAESKKCSDLVINNQEDIKSFLRNTFHIFEILHTKLLSHPHKGGLIFILSGPSCVGKSTILQRITNQHKNIQAVVSYTTRKPRPHEKNGVDYHFIDEVQFKKMLEANLFVTSLFFNNNHYGITRKNVEEILEKGNDVILLADPIPAFEVKKFYPMSQLIYIMPDNFETILHRLRNREDEKDLTTRIIAARNNLAYMNKYDYVLVNVTDQLNDTIQRLKSIIDSCHARTPASSSDSLINDFKDKSSQFEYSDFKRKCNSFFYSLKNKHPILYSSRKQKWMGNILFFTFQSQRNPKIDSAISKTYKLTPG